jgi:hypothetical protein
MDLARLFRVCSVPYGQVQPSVLAVGALAIEQGRVGMAGWSEVESTENCQNDKTGNPGTLYIAITYYS